MHSKHARHLMEDVIDNNGITGIHGEHLSTDAGNAYHEEYSATNGSVQCIGRQAARIGTS
jgi:hypothetical protein